jgi:hypothetical protein
MRPGEICRVCDLDRLWRVVPQMSLGPAIRDCPATRGPFSLMSLSPGRSVTRRRRRLLGMDRTMLTSNVKPLAQGGSSRCEPAPRTAGFADSRSPRAAPRRSLPHCRSGAGARGVRSLARPQRGRASRRLIAHGEIAQARSAPSSRRHRGQGSPAEPRTARQRRSEPERELSVSPRFPSGDRFASPARTPPRWQAARAAIASGDLDRRRRS